MMKSLISGLMIFSVFAHAQTAPAPTEPVVNESPASDEKGVVAPPAKKTPQQKKFHKDIKKMTKKSSTEPIPESK